MANCAQKSTVPTLVTWIYARRRINCSATKLIVEDLISSCAATSWSSYEPSFDVVSMTADTP